MPLWGPPERNSSYHVIFIHDCKRFAPDVEALFFEGVGKKTGEGREDLFSRKVLPPPDPIPPTPKTFGWWGGCSAGVPVGWERDRAEKGGCTYSQQIAVGPVSAFFLIMSWRLIY
jgi:hypothetical protein